MEKKSFSNKIAAFLQDVADLVRQDFGCFMLFWLLSCSTQVIKWGMAGKTDLVMSMAFTGLLGALFVTFITRWLFVPKACKIIRCILGSVLFAAFVIEAFVLYQYGALTGVGTINSLFETNPEESAEFINTFVGVEGGILAIVIAAVMYYLVRYKPWRRLEADAISQKVIAGIVMAVSSCYAIYMCFAYPGIMFGGDNLTPLTRLMGATSTAWKNHVAYQELQAKLDVDIHLTRNEGKITNIVFILGESTNRNHMHLYGYSQENTPNLDDMAKKGEIVFFRDVVSAHSTTVASLSKIFTFCDHESEKPWYEYNNLIDIMNAAGYKTHWLSNQESSGIWGNVAQIYAAHSNVSHYTQIRDSKEDEGRVDGELFPLVDNAIADINGSTKNFFVVHLMGAHLAYYNRYPYEFTKFTEASIKGDQYNDDQKQVIAQYDNALFYNDYIVSGIIDKFREINSDTIVIYLPDHGEAVYDEGGVNGHIEENPSRHMIEVPLIMWASEKFKQNHPEKWALIQEAINNPYMTDDMIHTVLDIADIHTADFDPTKSIISQSFNRLRPRIFDDKDYDREILAAGK
ncbi:putative membrane-associated, metal-dependent hydrolase [Anaerovibrio sp. JC8]|uniref:phosphoethanolamine transferase n=1 Tax=Anaerovibrio sp. JC8 TaxID=1240085 RepID=UPI000A0D0760|nr:phosphoethanolamine transferase [Anaerovibrio sp. JC8]ORU00248.1 putative membrane-associated, metal-dependent hydrolase [Anaerovibrio sp. JC8]